DAKALEGRELCVRTDPVFGDSVVTFADLPLVQAMQLGHGWVGKAFGKPPYRPGDRIPEGTVVSCVPVKVREITEAEAMAEGFAGYYSPAYVYGGEIVGPDGASPL